MDEVCMKVDPNLLQWIAGALGRDVESPDELERITALEAESFRWGAPRCPGWLALSPSDWSLIGALPNLEKLEFPNIPDIGMRYSFARRGPTEFCWSEIESYSFLLKCRQLKHLDLSQTNFYESWYLENLGTLEYLALPPSELPDFSFLQQLKNLTTLDVSRTNFRDCALLACLPKLESVILPSIQNLIHCEMLDTLTTAVKTREPEPQKVGPLPYYLSKRKVRRGENEVYAQIIVADNHRYQGIAITKEVIQKLVNDIAAGKIHTVTVSADKDLESVLFTAEIKSGCAILALQDFEEDICYLPYSPGQEEEPAPPRLGGQSPIPKSRAVEDLKLAADCVRHYIKSGKLSSKIMWERDN